MRSVVVLYEDRLGRNVKQFGLHELLVSCVADRIGADRLNLGSSLRGLPLKSNTKVHAKCQRELDLLSRRGEIVIAVYDSDAAHRIADVPPESCRPDITNGLAEGCEPKDRLRVVLLDKNLETVVEKLKESGLRVSDREIRQAVEEKNLATRDIVLNRAAYGDFKEIRQKLVAGMPSFGYLVAKVADACSGSNDGER